MKHSPMPRKRVKPRTTKSAKCYIQRCGKPARVDRYCRTHATKEADRMFSILVRQRDGKCVRCDATTGLQCAHVISRRYRATRWDPENAVCFCFRCHHWQGNWPLEGDVFFDQHWGKGHVAEMRYRALNWPTPDLVEVLYELRKVVAA